MDKQQFLDKLSAHSDHLEPSRKFKNFSRGYQETN